MNTLRITRLDPTGYRRTPWKNGGGVAIEIASASLADSATGTWHDTIWSFGRTTIETAAPFSDFSGFDRMQVVVRGRGLVLQTPSGEIDLRQPGVPARFAGHTPIVTRLEAGPVEVVNLIGDRRRVAIDLVLLAAGHAVVLSSGLHLLYAAFEPSLLRCDGVEHALLLDHGLQLDCVGDVTISCVEGRALIGSVFSNPP